MKSCEWVTASDRIDRAFKEWKEQGRRIISCLLGEIQGVRSIFSEDDSCVEDFEYNFKYPNSNSVYPPYLPDAPKTGIISFLELGDPGNRSFSVAQVGILVSTRGFPPADELKSKQALKKHFELLKSPLDDITQSMYEKHRNVIQVCAQSAGSETRKQIRKDFPPGVSAHCSTSNSGCYEKTRRQGGRSQAVRDIYHNWQQTLYTGERKYRNLPIGIRVELIPNMLHRELYVLDDKEDQSIFSDF